MGIYEYRTKLLGRPMSMVEVLNLYPKSVLAKSTKLAKKCGAFHNKNYTLGIEGDINKCGSNPLYTRKIQEYWEENQLTGSKASCMV